MRSTSIPSPEPPLSDGVVRVRYRLATDHPAIAAASRDVETNRWMLDEPVDEAEVQSSLDRIADAFSSGTSAPLVVADARTDEPVGLINLQFRSDDVATIAYSVFPEQRGRGIAGRSVGLVARWATEELHVRTLLLEIDAENHSSIRVAEKCGFASTAQDLETPEGKVVYAYAGGA